MLKSYRDIAGAHFGSGRMSGGTGLNMLESFYKNPQRFLQQNAAAPQSTAALLLMERLVLTDRCVFVEAAMEQEYFNSLEAAAYGAWYDGVVTTLPNVVPGAFVCLRADPNVCYERLKARARSKEAEVNLEYVQSLHSKHEKWFIESAFDNAGNWGGKSQGDILAPIQGRQQEFEVASSSLLIALTRWSSTSPRRRLIGWA